MSHQKFMSITKLAVSAMAVATLSACSTIGYRCPLDSSEEVDSPTACTSMQQAYTAAKEGRGGQLSVMMDDQGRIVPRELAERRLAVPLAPQAGKEPYRAKSGEPVFQQPKVFQVWASSFVDANGHLHDGHTAWFATPGRWSYGTVNQPGVVGSAMLNPATPDERPNGKVLTNIDPRTGQPMVQKGGVAQQQVVLETQQDRDKAALKNLSAVANSASKQPVQQQPTAVAPAPAPGVTAPAVNLAN